MAAIAQYLLDTHKEIYFIPGKNRARYPYSNSILIGNYLIDTGISSKYMKKLKRKYPIEHVILSHWHEDHISGNQLLPDAKFYCHILDKPIIEDIEKMIRYYNIEFEPVGQELEKMINLLGIVNTPIDETLNDNEIVNIGDTMQLKVLHTPGHTAGHCSFMELSSKVGFFGDIDLSNFPYYGNIDANLIELEHSIKRLSNLDFDIVVTGHRDPIMVKRTIKEELKKYDMIIKEREKRILEEFPERTKPIHPSHLKNKNLIYKKYSLFKDFEILAEELMIEKHFKKLEFFNKITFEGEGYILA